jgi:hypothetical protein
VVVALGLLLVPSRLLGATIPDRLRVILVRSSIAAGALGIAFLAVWSLQPGFWQGVGSRGPSTLADFSILTASQPGTLSTTPTDAQIAFYSPEVLAARESAVRPSLKLAVTAPLYFAQTTVGTPRSGGIAQKLKIQGWGRDRGQVRSLWVSALLGRPAWGSEPPVVDGVPRALGGVPDLMVQGRPISSTEATWVTPGWAVVTYNVPVSALPASGRLRVEVRASAGGGDTTAWNGTPRMRWLFVSMHSGMAAATVGDVRWRGLVTLPTPVPAWWFQGHEEASLPITGLTPSPSYTISRVVIGGQPGAVSGGSFAWPSSDGLDHTIAAPLLLSLGVLDAVVLLGGAWVLGRWSGRNRAQHARSRAQASRAEALLLPSSGAFRPRCCSARCCSAWCWRRASATRSPTGGCCCLTSSPAPASRCCQRRRTASTTR